MSPELLTDAEPITALALIEKLTPMQLFEPGRMQPLLDRIKAEVLAVDTDISTEEGRKAISSLAYKVSRTKTFIDAQRVNLVSDEKKRLAAIDAEGKRVREELDALKEQVRKPLTDWENRQQSRIAEYERRIAAMQAIKVPEKATTADIHTLMDRVDELGNYDFEEFTKRASAAKSVAMSHLRTQLQLSNQADEDRAEIKRLEDEANEKARVQREAQVAEDARVKAEKEAADRADQVAQETRDREAKIKREAQEKADQAAKEAREREEAIAREKEASDERARKAESDRIAADRRAKDDATRARLAAERDRLAAEEKAERDKQAAVDAERKRQDDERRAEQKRLAEEEAERVRRENDKKHRATINREALTAFTRAGVDETVAKTVIELIAKKQIPNVAINY